MAGFVYNPAESIKQDFQQTGSAMGNIFAQIIQQQKRDYDIAENAYANIEALKKDLNIYGQKSVTDKANALLGNVGSAILANGKLDYSKLGEVRRAVSDIKDLKTGYDLAAKEYEKRLQLGISTKEDFGSFEKFYTDMNKVMSNENLIKNPRDLQVAFSKVYTNNLDSNKKFIKTFTSISPLVPVEKEITNSKGGKTLVKTQAPQLWEIGENGASMPEMIDNKNPDGTVTKVPYLKYITELIKGKDSTLIPLIREQNPAATANLSDEQIIDFNIRTQISLPSSIIEKKSAAGVKKEEAEAKIFESKAENQAEEFRLDRLKTLTTIEANRASIAKDLALAKKANGEGFPAKSLSDFGITKDGFNFGDEVTVPVKNQKGQTSYIKATKLKWSPDGKLMVEGVPGKTDAMTNVFVPTGGVQLYPADENTLAAFKMAVNNMGPDKQMNITTGYALFNSLPRPKTTDELLSGFGATRAPKTAGDLINYVGAPKQKAAAAPVSKNKPIISGGKSWTPIK